MREILFVTAQPDKPYFHWQVILYVHNFIKLGIKANQINVLFGIVEGNELPSGDEVVVVVFDLNPALPTPLIICCGIIFCFIINIRLLKKDPKKLRSF